MICMRRIFLPVVLMLVVNCQSCVKADSWEMATQIEKEIKTTSFPPDTVSIIAFGAVPDDTSALNTTAINNAILQCNASGGGVVMVPSGIWHTGPVTLLSNVNLHLSAGATLLFSTDYEQYMTPVLTRWEGMDCFNIHPLIYANGQTNIAITGKGTVNGQASDEVWWWMNGNPDYGWKEGMNSQKTAGRPRLLAYEQGSVPVDQRVFGIADALRPQLINICNSNTVLIEGITIVNSPFWVIHPLLTDNFILRGVTIRSIGPNSDGCDPESCDHVLIENCFFDTGDDCIAIKSGRNNDGRRWNKPSKNIIVRNCRMAAGHGGVVIGSEISGGYSNLFVENCEMDSPELLRVIRIKTSDCRGGVIENINVRNVTVGKCSEAVLNINLKYEPGEECLREFPPYVRNVTLENVTSQESKYGVYIVGLDNSVNVSGITLRGCRFDGVKKGNSIKGAEKVTFDELLINGETARFTSSPEE